MNRKSSRLLSHLALIALAQCGSLAQAQTVIKAPLRNPPLPL